MDIKKIFFELADELDRHYVAPHIPQMLYLSPDDYREFEIGLKELQENSFSATYNTKGSFGEGTGSPQPIEAIHLTIAAYSFTIMKSDKSSLIWEALKNAKA